MCITATLTVALPTPLSLSDVIVTYDGIAHRVRNHKTLVVTTSATDASGEDKTPTVLTRKHPSFTLNLTKNTAALFSEFFYLGTAHILHGFDHLAYLLCLVWSVVWSVMRSRRSPAEHKAFQQHQIIKPLLISVSLFTAGHTLSLLISASDLIRVPVWLTEAGVAATVLVTALGLAFNPKQQKRWLVLVFGLIHGMAFSEVLADLPIDTITRLYAVAGFNSGVEIFQLCLAVLTVPLFVVLTRSGHAATFRYLFSLVVIVASLIWLSDRLMTLPPFIWVMSGLLMCLSVMLMKKPGWPNVSARAWK